MTQVSLVPILLWLAALLCAGIAVWREGPPMLRGFVIDRLLRYLFVFPLGIQGLWGVCRTCVLCRAGGRLDRLAEHAVSI
jgi:hypothetical protein